MALAETANLFVKLNLKDGLTPGLAKLNRSLGRFEASASRIRGHVSRGLGTAAANLAKIGAVATVGIAAMVKSGISDLAELEDAVTSVDGAIRQMGLTGKVTGAQVSDWANEIEKSIDAAFDDKAITAATATLIRLGKVSEKELRPAMEVLVDLAATMGGDLPGASKQLAKALAAPEKAAGRLARAGVILTEAQDKQLKAMVKAGDKAGAQALLLEIMAETTKDAADAMNGPYRDAMNNLNDVTEDARKALAIGFLPVLQKVAKWLSGELAKPETINAIKAFGQDLAKGFDKLLDIATRLPWDAIGASMRIAGAGASAILQAFASMPPWVQTAVLTGWGLNKLTGGALGDIVGELSKGLIRGVLGINAGVVNINAGVVNGGGGGGIPPVAGAAAAGIGAPGAATLGAGIGLALAPVLSAYLTQGADTQAIAIREGLGELSAKQVDMFQGLMPQFTALAANAGSQSLAPKLSSLQQQQVVNHATEERQASLLSQITAEERQAITATDNLRNRLATLQQRLHNAKEAGDRTRAAALRAKIEGVKARIATSNAKLEAIRRKKTQFNQKIVVPVTSTVTVRGVVVSRKLWNQYTKSSAGEFW